MAFAYLESEQVDNVAWAPDFCEYVKNTWLNPHKEKFVTAWVDRLMHMGNTTTNRYAQTRVLISDEITFWY